MNDLLFVALSQHSPHGQPYSSGGSFLLLFLLLFDFISYLCQIYLLVDNGSLHLFLPVVSEPLVFLAVGLSKVRTTGLLDLSVGPFFQKSDDLTRGKGLTLNLILQGASLLFFL
jgi:hypothetical protein